MNLASQPDNTALILDVAKRVKHSLFIHKKKLDSRRDALLSFTLAKQAQLLPYTYNPERYPHSFLLRSCPSEEVAPTAEVPRSIFVLWTGDNQLSQNRRRSLTGIQETIHTQVHFLTPNNLGDWVTSGHPLNPFYNRLSLTHRSDYLRAYLMHYYGGGYTDLKRPSTD